MSKETIIQWCDSTVNPTMGCDGCELWNGIVKKCYAGKITERYGGHSSGYPPTFDEVTMFPGRMAVAAKWSDLRGVERKDKPWIPKDYPRLVFISDMSDAMSRAVSFDYLKSEIIDVVARWPHIGLWLTKQPKRMAEFSKWLKDQGVNWPDNLWPGTSVTSPSKIHRIRELQFVGEPWTKRFVSFEPLLGRADFSALRRQLWEVEHTEFGKDASPSHLIQWVILGGESGDEPGSCDLTGMEDLLNMLREADVSVFVKQLGAKPYIEGPTGLGQPDVYIHPVKLQDKKGGDWLEWPSQFRVREFPSLEE